MDMEWFVEDAGLTKDKASLRSLTTAIVYCTYGLPPPVVFVTYSWDNQVGSTSDSFC